MENDPLQVYNSAIHKQCSLEQIRKKYFYSFVFTVSLSPDLFYFFSPKKVCHPLLNDLVAKPFVMLFSEQTYCIPLLSLLLFTDPVFHVILNCIKHLLSSKHKFHVKEWSTLSNKITSKCMEYPWASFSLWKMLQVGVNAVQGMNVCKASSGMVGLVSCMCCSIQ